MHDKVKLKDGRTGFVVEFFNGDEVYIVEVDERKFEDCLVTVNKEDIERILEKHEE